MRNFRRFLGGCRAAAACFAAVCFATGVLSGCTDVDDMLGSNLVPNDQVMTVKVGSSTSVEMFQAASDSIVGSHLGNVFFGKSHVADFGKRINGFVFQFKKYSLPYASGFGIDPILDSLVISFSVDEVLGGDTTVEQTFDVYRITKDLIADSTYYTSFPAEEYADMSEPLFTFTHSGAGNLVARLKPYGAAGQEYLEEFLKTDTTVYNTDSLFLEKFKGLFVTPSENSPAGAIYTSSMLAEAGQSLLLFTRDHDSVDTEQVKDTLITTFMVLDESYYVDDMTSINKISYDYTGSPLAGVAVNDTLPGSPQPDVVYVEGGAGMTAYMRFGEDFIRTVQSWKGDKSAMVINQARIMVPLKPSPSAETLDNALPRLGAYYNVAKGTPIPDYLYPYESQSTLAYGGYLNRSNDCYEMDITGYVQRLVSAQYSESTPRVMVLAPPMTSVVDSGNSAVYTTINSYGDVALAGGGDSDNPIRIVVTYTLIE